jgi:hypothetical protein
MEKYIFLLAKKGEIEYYCSPKPVAVVRGLPCVHTQLHAPPTV